MNVQELIERLQDCDPNAEVVILQQPHWPFIYETSKVATTRELILENLGDIREEMEQNGVDLTDLYEDEVIERYIDETFSDREGKVTDTETGLVYIVEGTQLRYARGVEGKGF